MSAAAMNDMFNAYGDVGGRWIGGDGTASVTLPDGRIVWLFADTMLGTVNPDHSRPPSSPMVNNVMVVQHGTTLTATLHGGTAAVPKALVEPEQSGEHFWVMDGVVEGNTLKVLYNRIRTTGTGALDFEQTGVALATFALPALTLTSVVDLPLGPHISWGSGIFPDGAWTYIYGISSAPGRLKFAHLARVRAGGISGPWEYWTGSRWSTNLTDAGKLLSGVDGGGVQRIGSQYLWVTHENNLVFDPQFLAYTSTSPTGPFAGPIPLFTAPEQHTSGLIVYDARVHPHLARSGKLLVSYNVNSLNPGGTTVDVRHGRPRFVEVDWPRPATAGVPAAPAAPTITAQNERAQLTWPSVGGATGYRIYQRNVTGGQTHFARLPQTPTGTSATAGFLVPGHTYEFKITAVNRNGEGAFSPVRTATPHNTTPVGQAIGNHGLATAVAGAYIVELEDTVPKAAVASYARALAAQYGGEVTGIMTSVLSGFTVLLSEAKAHDLALHPDVKFVQQDQTGRTFGVQTDPTEQGLGRIDQEPRSLDQRYV
jgi:fibronectin type III domain protein